MHGLAISYFEGNKVDVHLWKDGTDQGWFYFDRDFIEHNREGNVHELTAGHFDPADENP